MCNNAGGKQDRQNSGRYCSELVQTTNQSETKGNNSPKRRIAACKGEKVGPPKGS